MRLDDDVAGCANLANRDWRPVGHRDKFSMALRKEMGEGQLRYCDETAVCPGTQVKMPTLPLQ